MTTTSSRPYRRTLPLAAWPEPDRRLWQQALGSDYAASLKANSVANLRKGYGRWLHWLASQEQLDETTRPAHRLTPDRIRAYVVAVRGEGIADATVMTLLEQLRASLRILEPRVSFSWLPVIGGTLRLPRRVERGGHHGVRTDATERNLKAWPDIDRALWRVGLLPGDILDDPKYAARLRPSTIASTTKGYQRWLAFLHAEGRLDARVPPAARVSEENVRRYMAAMRDARYRNSTMITKMTELRAALHILQPDSEFGWLTSPGGRSLGSLLPVERRPMQVPSSKVLYEWGQTLMQAALDQPHPDLRRIGYRDGLLIALLAARAPRIRAMASLRLGQHLVLIDDGYRLVFKAEDIKTGRPLEYDLPAGLSSAIEHYVSVPRAELLAGQSHDWFWVDACGRPLSQSQLGNIIRRRSKQRFGTAFGPHRFRHAMGTTAPLVDPANPGVASAILGISVRMVEEHYNRAGQVEAALRFHSSLRDERARTRALAQKEFRKQGRL